MIGELDQTQIDTLLQSEVIGRIGCYANGMVYVVPVTYVYDGNFIYGHTDEGMKMRFIRTNPRVCFQVDHVDNIANWQSAIVQGTFQELNDGDADRAVVLLKSRLLPSVANHSATVSGGLESYVQYRMQTASRHGIIYRISIKEKTGRFEKN